MHPSDTFIMPTQLASNGYLWSACIDPIERKEKIAERQMVGTFMTSTVPY